MPWQTTWLIEVQVDLRVAAIVERRGHRAVVHAELEDEAVDRLGGDAGLDDRRQLVEAARR